MALLFSANSHLIEPAHVFQGRMSRKWAERAPRLVEAPGGGHQWVFEGVVRPILRACAVAGTPPETWGGGAVHMSELRPGCYDAKARLEDMNLDGVTVTTVMSSPASMGFNGDLFSRAKDPELGLESMRAWNDWYFEEWVGAAPGRFVPVGQAWYLDPRAAADEVVRNARRGFKAVVFRNPVDLGQPWVGTGHWDPFLRACEETGTVVIYHTETLPWWPRREEGVDSPYPYGMVTSLFQSSAMDYVNSFLWGGVSVRFPKLKIMIAEAGGSWLPHLLKHTTWAVDFCEMTRKGWPDPEMSPLDMIRRTFVFSTLELEVAAQLQADYGIEGWMIEDDYPHLESVWPNTQAHYARELGSFAPDQAEMLAWRNASALFRHPVPSDVAAFRGRELVGP